MDLSDFGYSGNCNGMDQFTFYTGFGVNRSDCSTGNDGALTPEVAIKMIFN